MNRTTIIMVALAAGTALADGADLKVFDWSGYEDQGFFGSYMEKYGAAPTYTFFGSQEEAFTKLQSGFEADLAHPCSDAVRKWVAADLIQPLDPSKLNNWDAMLEEIKDVDIETAFEHVGYKSLTRIRKLLSLILDLAS